MRVLVCCFGFLVPISEFMTFSLGCIHAGNLLLLFPIRHGKTIKFKVHSLLYLGLYRLASWADLSGAAIRESFECDN